MSCFANRCLFSSLERRFASPPEQDSSGGPQTGNLTISRNHPDRWTRRTAPNDSRVLGWQNRLPAPLTDIAVGPVAAASALLPVFLFERRKAVVFEREALLWHEVIKPRCCRRGSSPWTQPHQLGVTSGNRKRGVKAKKAVEPSPPRAASFRHRPDCP
jgi:hypothetical protein